MHGWDWRQQLPAGGGYFRIWDASTGEFSAHQRSPVRSQCCAPPHALSTTIPLLCEYLSSGGATEPKLGIRSHESGTPAIRTGSSHVFLGFKDE
jgi:hypothetical protein